MWSVEYKPFGRAVRIVYFDTEKEMRDYCTIWFDGDEDYAIFFDPTNREYFPTWYCGEVVD